MLQHRDHGWFVKKLRRLSLKSKNPISSFILLIPTFFFLLSILSVRYISQLAVLEQKELFGFFQETALEKLINWIPYMNRIHYFLETRNEIGRYYLITNAYTVSVVFLLVSVAIMAISYTAYVKANIHDLDMDIIKENIARYPPRTTMEIEKTRSNFAYIVLLICFVISLDILYGAFDVNRITGFGNIVQSRDVDIYRWAIQFWVVQFFILVVVHANRIGKGKHHGNG